MVVHALCAGAVALSSILIYRITTTAASPRAGIVASVLFTTYEATKVLASWASGFQDLLALVLILGSSRFLQTGHFGLALLLAALAPLAKESGFTIYPIGLLYIALHETTDRRKRMWVWGLTSLIPVAIHLVARLTWHYTGSPERHLQTLARMAQTFAEAARFFVGATPVMSLRSILLAGASAIVVLILFHLSRRTSLPSDAVADRRWFALAAAAGGVPILGAQLGFAYANAYHLIPVVPWVCMWIGSATDRLSRGFLIPGTMALVAWNTLCLAPARVDLDRPDTWNVEAFTWADALRFRAVTLRLSYDLKAALAPPPESLVVLFQNMPPRTFFQTEDGPAVREVLQATSAVGYFIGEAPWFDDDRPVRIMTFDFDSLHLRRVSLTVAEGLHRASNAIVAGRGGTGAAIIRATVPDGTAEPARSYLLAAAAMVSRGPDLYLQRLRALGLTDTTGSALVRLAWQLAAGDAHLAAALQYMLAHPLSAGPCVILADAYEDTGTLQGAAVSLRLAVTLDPRDWPSRLRLALLMNALGGLEQAREELETIASSPDAGDHARMAREVLTGWTSEIDGGPPSSP